MTSVHAHIKARISRAPGAVVTAKDFSDLGQRDAVDQALGRLTKAGIVTRIGRGLYHRPRVNKRLGITIPPNPDLIASAIGRQTGHHVAPSPARAANALGLSTQVPAKLVYLTDGPSRAIQAAGQVFHFKHVSSKRLPRFDDPTLSLAASAIVAPANAKRGPQLVQALRDKLSPPQRVQLAKKMMSADDWVSDVARQIAEPVA